MFLFRDPEWERRFIKALKHTSFTGVTVNPNKDQYFPCIEEMLVMFLETYSVLTLISDGEGGGGHNDIRNKNLYLFKVL